MDMVTLKQSRPAWSCALSPHSPHDVCDPLGGIDRLKHPLHANGTVARLAETPSHRKKEQVNGITLGVLLDKASPDAAMSRYFVLKCRQQMGMTSKDGCPVRRQVPRDQLCRD
jgi:hypothetical protein